MQVRAGRGPSAAGGPDDLAARDVLPLGDPDPRKVSVKGHQTVAVVDLHRLPAQTGVTAGHEPVCQDDSTRRRGGDRLVVEAVVVAVVAGVVEVVLQAGSLRVSGAKSGIGPTDPGRGDDAVIAADPSTDVVVGPAVVEDRGDVVGTPERKRHECAWRRRLVDVGGPVLEWAVADLVRVRPTLVLARCVSGRQRRVCLRGQRKKGPLREQRKRKQRREGDEKSKNPHSHKNGDHYRTVAPQRPALVLVKFRK